MDHTVTVGVRGLLLAGLAVLALLAAYLLGGAGSTTVLRADAADGRAADASEAPRTLRMVGTGVATVVPDQLAFDLAVTDKRPALEEALAGSSATLDRVLGALREHGVRDRDVQTTGLRMHPEYDYPESGPPVLTGYRVTQRAVVTVRDLAAGGRAITSAVTTGGDGVRATHLRLGVADPEAALGEAREAAVADATRKAERSAEAAGQSLGEVMSLREVGPSGPRPPRWDSHVLEHAARDLAEVPIRAGRDDLTVRVELVWAFA